MTTKLPILPTATAFCGAYIPLDLFDADGELAFFVDGNSKITAGNGSYEAPAPNAFSLPAASVDGGAACPGSTEVCRASCYVKGLAKHAPDIYAAYTANARVLDHVLRDGLNCLGEYAADALATWITEHAPHGFRWHVSGDVQSVDHANWIVEVCERAPDVRFWIYTRTMGA